MCFYVLRSELKDAIREGGVPFNRVYGTHAFEYPKLDSRFNEVFNTAMINHTTLVMKKILESYNGLEGIKRLVDVGGGLGINISFITSKYPHIHGINFDLPHVIQHAPSYPGIILTNPILWSWKIKKKKKKKALLLLLNTVIW